MLYSQTTKYCVIALADLARRQADHGVTVRAIARETGIPAPFLARLVSVLVRAGFVTAQRGRDGGLRLARDPAQISLADVVRATEGETYFEDCVLTLGPCDGTEGCLLHALWGPTRDHVVSFLEGTTIEAVAHVKRSAERTEPTGTKRKNVATILRIAKERRTSK